MVPTVAYTSASMALAFLIAGLGGCTRPLAAHGMLTEERPCNSIEWFCKSDRYARTAP